MTLHEIEKAVSRLSPHDLTQFSEWFEEYRAEAWDRQIERDVRSGRLDEAIRQADDDFKSGRYTPL